MSAFTPRAKNRTLAKRLINVAAYNDQRPLSIAQDAAP